MKLLVLNGPNLNMLGIREPDIYGKKTYNDLIDMIEKHCAEKSVSVKCLQSNSEGGLIDILAASSLPFNASCLDLLASSSA